MKHILESEQVKSFFVSCGIVFTEDSCHNCIILMNTNTGDTLEIYAESDIGIAEGIPGFYVDEQNNIVNKWKWVYVKDGKSYLTGDYYSEKEFMKLKDNYDSVLKIDNTMIEVDE